VRAYLPVATSILLVSTLLSGQSPAPATNAQMPDQNVMTLKQEVRNVVIDVVVTDKHGKPVKALPKANFQVFENGVPQDIQFLEEHSVEDEAATPAQSAAALPALPPDVHTNVTSAPSKGPLMAVLLDALNTAPGNQSYVRAQVLEYLKQIQPGTQMAIFALGDRLQLIQGFTSDPAILRAALNNKAYPSFTTLSADSVMTDPSGESSGGTSSSAGSAAAGPSIPFSGGVSAVRSSLERFGNGNSSLDQELRVRYTLDALNALAVYLAGIEGRKNLVWFSGQIPWNVNPDFSLVTDPTGREDYGEELKQLANVMTVGRIAVYPIDSNGLVTPPGYSPDNVRTAGSSAGSTNIDPSGSQFGARGQGGTFGEQEMSSQINAAGNHMSMANLAAATGGRALYNTNGLAGAVAKVHGIAENYYTLAYSPKDKKYDGNLRQIQVKLSEAGVKLEYRRGYYAEDPGKLAKRSQTVSSNPLHTVMQRGAPDATEIPFKLKAEQATRQPDASKASDRIGNSASSLKGPLVRYDFHWDVDLNSVSLIRDESGMLQGEVDTVLDAYDAEGKILNNIYATLPLRFNEAEYARRLKSGLSMKQTLDVPLGEIYLRAGLLDPSNGHTGATEFPMAVKAATASVAQSSGKADGRP
jgi:VWFA-related protein